MSKESLGEKLRRLRLENHLPLRKVAATLDMDVAILSKMERGERKLTKSVVIKLAELYQHDPEELMVIYLSEKILHELNNEKLALRAIKDAEEQILYKLSKTKAARGRARTKIMTQIKKYFQSQDLVTKAWIFGSFARGDDNVLSDIDIMVRFDRTRPITFFDLAEITDVLGLKTGRKIDLVEEGHLEKFAQKTAEKDLTLIYG